MKKIIIVLLIATGQLSCGKRGKELKYTTIIDEIITVKTEKIGYNNDAEPIEASGLVASLSERRLSFKTGGIIEKIYVKEGQQVSKGQLLATLNLTEINASVQQAKESVTKAERDLKRITNLYADSVSTLEQVQNLTTVLSLAKQNLQIAQYNRIYSQIHAPISGTIVKKIMNEGELCGPGNPVFFMNATGQNSWILKAGITDFVWARLQIGNLATVVLDAFPNNKLAAKVLNLSQAPDQSSGLYQAEILIDPAGLKLATGLFGKTKIIPSIVQNKYSITINSLIEGNNKNAFVYTIDSNSIAKKIPIVVDYIANGRVFLKDFPKEISEVITDGSAYLVEGSKVKVAP